MTDESESWDLWQVWSNRPSNYERVLSAKGSIDEYRVYERIYKSDIWYVATRENKVMQK